jgi:hypothetical protein
MSRVPGTAVIEAGHHAGSCAKGRAQDKTKGDVGVVAVAVVGDGEAVTDYQAHESW